MKAGEHMMFDHASSMGFRRSAFNFNAFPDGESMRKKAMRLKNKGKKTMVRAYEDKF